jgi:hypothetical protein
MAFLLLGADFAVRIGCWCHSQRKIYFTYAGGPVFQLNQPPARYRTTLGRQRKARFRRELAMRAPIRGGSAPRRRSGARSLPVRNIRVVTGGVWVQRGRVGHEEAGRALGDTVHQPPARQLASTVAGSAARSRLANLARARAWARVVAHSIFRRAAASVLTR